MQLKDVTPIIKAILEERDKIPRIIDKERYIPNPQPYHYGDFVRGGIRKALRIIEKAPVVDSAPVVHARWVHEQRYGDSGGWVWRCTACRHEAISPIISALKYCHSCGAKMDGGADNG